MRATSLVALAFVLAAGSASGAQLYRWVDEKGNVEWRDTPPPSTAKNVERRNVGSNTIETSTLPYSVQQAIKNFPVTLWTADCGEACTKGRSHLARRGTPYTERNAQKEFETLKKVTGGIEIPVLIVGSQQLKGYGESQWDAALDGAGYPRTLVPGMKPQAQVKGAPEPAAKPGGDGAAKGTSTPPAR